MRQQRDVAIQERLSALVSSAPLVLFAVGEDGIVTLCEGRGMRTAGIQAEELVGRHYRRWRRATPTIARNIGRALKGEAFSDALEFEGRTFVVHYVPVSDRDGRPDGMLGISTDVTERDNEAAQRQHSETLESLSVLAGGFAHDVNDLLTRVLGNAQLAMTELPSNAPVRERLERIRSAAREAAKLTEELLAYAGEAPLSPQRIDLAALAAEVVERRRALAPVAVELLLQTISPLPPVELDPERISEMLDALLANAFEALGEAGGVVRVRTGVRRVDRDYLRETWLREPVPEGHYAFVEVRDSGPGVDPSVSGHLFDPFCTTRFPGRGLGLARVLGTVRAHRGAIRLRSEPRGGTAVEIVLPLAPRASDALSETSRSPSRRSARGRPASGPGSSWDPSYR